jgi:hypothetical protein
MWKKMEVTGKTWTGQLTDPRCRKQLTDENPQVEFLFSLTDPVQAETRVRIYTDQPATLITVNQYSDVAKKMCAAKGVKLQVLKFQVPDDQAEAVRAEAARIYAEHVALQHAVTVTTWHWSLGGDTHRCLLYPNEDKDTDEITEITRIAHDAPGFDDLIRPKSRVVDRDVPGLYTFGPWYEISDEDLRGVIADYKAAKAARKVARAQAEEQRYQAALKIAQETGHPAILRQWTEECNDPHEDCDMDNLIEYVHPDGSKKIRRSHTW